MPMVLLKGQVPLLLPLPLLEDVLAAEKQLLFWSVNCPRKEHAAMAASCRESDVRLLPCTATRLLCV